MDGYLFTVYSIYLIVKFKFWSIIRNGQVNQFWHQNVKRNKTDFFSHSNRVYGLCIDRITTLIWHTLQLQIMVLTRLLLLAIATVLVVVYGKNDPPFPPPGPPLRPQSDLAGGGLVAVGSITVLSLAG